VLRGTPPEARATNHTTSRQQTPSWRRFSDKRIAQSLRTIWLTRSQTMLLSRKIELGFCASPDYNLTGAQGYMAILPINRRPWDVAPIAWGHTRRR
jgi:hypothetical protein